MNPAGTVRRADVAIVGGGAAGTAAALLLARLGASVVIVDRGTARVTLGESLPPAARPVLEHLCLWESFLAGGHLPTYGNRSCWGSPTPLDSDFIRSAYEHGWHLDRRRFDAMLGEALADSRVPVLEGVRVLECRRGGASWTLSMKTGDGPCRIDADFLIDASGRARQIARRTLHIERRVYDRLVAAVGILAPGMGDPDLDSFTQIEAMTDGWWYASLLPDGRLAAGYMTDADRKTASEARAAAGWMSLLEGTVQVRARVAAHGYRLQGSITRTSADSSRLSHVAGDGWCAVGDAAAAYDPLSSQGIASALLTGTWAAQAVADRGRGGIATYKERMRHHFARYLAEWLNYYALEQRWPGSAFWQRRHRALGDLLRE